MTNPYKDLEARAFWSPAVGQRNMFDIDDLWRPKFKIAKRGETVTFGSCFAQHFAKALRARKFAWVNKEPAPKGMSSSDAAKYNYGIFSARTGNIYTTSLLLQWTKWALGEETAPDEVWEKDGRFYDPFRPAIEPNGFASREEVLISRAACIEAFGKCITETRMFVFTLGLTESWWHKEGGYEYPMCPGTVAGDFDPDSHEFLNQDYDFVFRNLTEALSRMRKANKAMKVLLTVSPVPLTATYSGNHVLVATMESKSILRAAAAAMAKRRIFVDYFPSYEIINSAPYRASFFEQNMRSVNAHGVDHVMQTFFAGLPESIKSENKAAKVTRPPRKSRAKSAEKKKADDLVCEEELLAALAPDDAGAR